jgi:hypothetical protein
VAADDITMSPVHGRDVAVLSMIVMGDKNKTAPASLFALYAQGLENITTTKYEGVPHWGKKVTIIYIQYCLFSPPANNTSISVSVCVCVCVF